MAEVPQVERPKHIPRRRQGHEDNMMYGCVGICEPNQFHGYGRIIRGGMVVRVVHLLLSLLLLATVV